jgi:Flp pilus assembly pilin Flp
MKPEASPILSFFRDESGATSVEYAILASLIAAVCVAAIFGLGETTKGLFTSFSASYPDGKP